MPQIEVNTSTPTGYTIATMQSLIDGMVTNMAQGKPILAADVAELINIYNTYRVHEHDISDLRGIDTFGNLGVYGAGTYYANSTTPPSDASPGSIQSLSIVAQETTPTAIRFNADGTKMYVAGSTGNIHQYTLGTAWDLTTTTFLHTYITGVDQTVGLAFSSDGFIMYTLNTLTDVVLRYNLSTAWNISTASLLNSIDVSATDGWFTGVYFNPTGTKMYLVGDTNDYVYQYTLTSAWDITTATTGAESYVSVAQDAVPTDVFFSPDGTQMFTSGRTNDAIYRYTISPAWELSSPVYGVSTSTYTNQTLNTTTQTINPSGLHFSYDGTLVFIVGKENGHVFRYTLGDAWDLRMVNIQFFPEAPTLTNITNGGTITAADINAIMWFINDIRVHQHTTDDVTS